MERRLGPIGLSRSAHEKKFWGPILCSFCFGGPNKKRFLKKKNFKGKNAI